MTQLVVLAAMLVSAAGAVDHLRSVRAADLAAERGAGPRVSFLRAHLRAAAPIAVDIPRLGVHSSLVDLRTNPNGTLQVPRDYRQAGWYVGSAHPGDAGPTVIVGHVDSKNGPGIFYQLRTLRRGDVISVRRADRTTVRFVVQQVRTVPKSKFPTALVYRGDGRPSLRLITCGGAFDRASGHYLDNTVVFATPYVTRVKHPTPARRPMPTKAVSR